MAYVNNRSKRKTTENIDENLSKRRKVDPIGTLPRHDVVSNPLFTSIGRNGYDCIAEFLEFVDVLSFGSTCTATRSGLWGTVAECEKPRNKSPPSVDEIIRMAPKNFTRLYVKQDGLGIQQLTKRHKLSGKLSVRDFDEPLNVLPKTLKRVSLTLAIKLPPLNFDEIAEHPYLTTLNVYQPIVCHEEPSKHWNGNKQNPTMKKIKTNLPFSNAILALMPALKKAHLFEQRQEAKIPRLDCLEELGLELVKLSCVTALHTAPALQNLFLEELHGMCDLRGIDKLPLRVLRIVNTTCLNTDAIGKCLDLQDLYFQPENRCSFPLFSKGANLKIVSTLGVDDVLPGLVDCTRLEKVSIKNMLTVATAAQLQRLPKTVYVYINLSSGITLFKKQYGEVIHADGEAALALAAPAATAVP